MKIHEYQGKELFRKFGLVTPRGFPCFSVDEAVEAAKKLSTEDSGRFVNGILGRIAREAVEDRTAPQ